MMTTAGVPIPETILIVEDNAALRKLAVSVLKDHGYAVLEAANAEQALAIDSQTPANLDLLIVNLVMPRMSGRQLAEHVALLRPNLRVLYTADAVPQHGAMDREANFINKPFTPVLLVQTIRKVMNGNPFVDGKSMGTVLVVDDDRDIQDLLCELLKVDFQVIAVGNGIEALNYLKHSDCQIVITDLIMPSKDGVDLIAEIKSAHPTLPIIAMSGQRALLLWVEATPEYGDVTILEKPFDVQGLRTVLQACLARMPRHQRH
jgi:DNA-binding NtrC family response regulator